MADTRRPTIVHAVLLTVSLLSLSFLSLPAAAQVWKSEGPGPINQRGGEGLPNVGAIQTVAPHPTDANILYVGSVNGGIWKTTNATAASPTWVAQTTGPESVSIGVIEHDPTDPSFQTLVAGVARTSAYAGVGGPLTGVLRTTNGGGTWTTLGGMGGRNIPGIAARGATIVAAVDKADTFECPQIGIFRSTDGGGSWAQVSGAGGSGLPGGATDTLESDPFNPSRLFTSVVSAEVCGAGTNGIYRSTDTGASWTKVSDGTMDTLLESATETNVKIAVGPDNGVFVGIVPASTSQLGGVFYSPDGGASWAQMDQPGTQEGATFQGIHPGKQGGIHFSLAADPGIKGIAYIGGDSQPSGSEAEVTQNSIGGLFDGRIFRGDATAGTGSQWAHLTHQSGVGPAGGGTANGTAPHADSRELEFDAAGNLIESDDGGVFKRTSPRSAAGDWSALHGDLRVTELHDLAYDSLSNILVGGSQDNGTPDQNMTGGALWTDVTTGDGGDVAVDATSTPGRSSRYVSSQSLGGFTRRVYDQNNVLQDGVMPELTVIGGDPFKPQFVNPVALNNARPTRLILGGENGVYESVDQGGTIAAIGAGIRANTSPAPNSIAYGAAGNEDILYVGACDESFENCGVYVRTAGGGALVRSVSYPGSVVRALVLDRNSGDRAFTVEKDKVYRTANSGASWSDITGNLGGFQAGSFNSVEYLNRPSGGSLVVGADRGVFIASEASGFSTWSPLGTGLDNALVYDLDYDAGRDKLVAGTMGRGAYSISLGGDTGPPPGGQCTATTATALCLSKRFQVEVDWRNPSGATGKGQAVDLTEDTGYFWFFSASNVEMVLKVLNGCGLNENFWVFAGGLTDVEVAMKVTDTKTGQVKTYLNPLGAKFQPIQDTGAFMTCSASTVDPAGPTESSETGSAWGDFSSTVAALSDASRVGSSSPTSHELSLTDGRFLVTADWRRPDGQSGQGQAVKLTGDTGYFWFFTANNVEMVIKVLNGCGLNQKFWVFAGGLTNVEVTITVTDTETGAVQVYANPQGAKFQPIQDTSAFGDCPM